MATVFTIGASGKTAEQFFTLLQANGVQTLVDVRLNNTSQLAGFTKKGNLEYFLDKICAINYTWLPELAPGAEMLKDYKNKKINWQQYESAYNSLLRKRNLEKVLNSINWDLACLLCSEKTPEFCHRRLAAEFLKGVGFVQEIRHLV